MMKKLVLLVIGIAGLAAPASAADMAVKAAPPPTVAPMIYNWTGFYIGANGGWGESHNCVDFFNAAGVGFAQGCRERSGGLIGGQPRYCLQAQQFLFRSGNSGGLGGFPHPPRPPPWPKVSPPP